MSFSESGGTIIQSGTDTNLSGLTGVTGVTKVGNHYFIAGTYKMQVTGTLTIIPEDDVLDY